MTVKATSMKHPNSGNLEQLQMRLRRVEQSQVESYYPTPEKISYVARCKGVAAFFLTDDAYSHRWFYPRYSGGKLHEPAATNYLVSHIGPDSVFVDVGAHLGYFSIIAAQRAKHVFAIEALEFLVPKIHRNAAANHLNNVQTLFAAAGAETGFVTMPKVGGPQSRIGSARSSSLVPLIKLDDYFHGEYKPTIMKIDTEGYEFQVLKGAAGILRHQPILLVEVHSRMVEFGASKGELFELLHDHGYRIRPLKHRQQSDAESLLSQAEFEAKDNAMVICEPA